MKEDKNNKDIKVLNVSLILFSLFYCWVFYKQWMFMIPMFILGTRFSFKFLVYNTSIIYFFCLFTNWFNIILLLLCFSFYLLVNRLVQYLILNEKYNYLISTFLVCFLLFRFELDINLSIFYSLVSVGLVFCFDNFYKKILKEELDYWLEVVSIQLSADKKTNGDYFDTLELNNYKYLFLSDGMGQGEKALSISENVVEKIKSFIKKGYSMKEAIDLSNELIANDENKFATLDAVECNSNSIKFFKRGAENSYLMRNNKITKIFQSNLPMGIEDNDFKYINQLIFPNDILLLYSDGVTLSHPNFEQDILTKKNENELVKWLEKISLNSKKEIKDDFSIILVKFNEKQECL